MRQLLFTLFLLFVAIIGPLSIDYHFCNCVSGRGLLGAFAGAMAVTGWAIRRCRRSAAEGKREERLARRASAHLLVEMYRKLHNERGEGCGGAILICMGLVVLLMLGATHCHGEEGNGLDAALSELTVKYQPELLLSADEFSAVRDLTTRTGLLIRMLQYPPAGTPADLQNRRARVRVSLEKVQDELLQLTVDHAASVLRRIQKEVAR